MWCSKSNEFMSIWSTLRQSHSYVWHRQNLKLPSYLLWIINPLWYTTSFFDAYTSHLYAQFWSQGCDIEFDIYMRLYFTHNLGRTYEYASHWREYSIVWGQISRISTSTVKSIWNHLLVEHLLMPCDQSNLGLFWNAYERPEPTAKERWLDRRRTFHPLFQEGIFICCFWKLS